MPLPRCVNPRCGRVHRKKGAFCSLVCQGQVQKQERQAKRVVRKKEDQ